MFQGVLKISTSHRKPDHFYFVIFYISHIRMEDSSCDILECDKSKSYTAPDSRFKIFLLLNSTLIRHWKHRVRHLSYVRELESLHVFTSLVSSLKRETLDTLRLYHLVSSQQQLLFVLRNFILVQCFPFYIGNSKSFVAFHVSSPTYTLTNTRIHLATAVLTAEAEFFDRRTTHHRHTTCSTRFGNKSRGKTSRLSSLSGA